MDFFGEIVTTRSIGGLFVREMKLDWTWPALAVFTLALVWAGPANNTGDPRKYKAQRNNGGKITDASGSRTGKFLNLFSVIR